jgi:hypothetical protein
MQCNTLSYSRSSLNLSVLNWNYLRGAKTSCVRLGILIVSRSSASRTDFGDNPKIDSYNNGLL